MTDLDKITRTISERPLTADEIASYTGYKAMKWIYRREAPQ